MDISSEKIKKIPITNFTEPFTICYDHLEGRIIWTDIYRNEINSIYMNGSIQKNILKTEGISLYTHCACRFNLIRERVV